MLATKIEDSVAIRGGAMHQKIGRRIVLGACAVLSLAISFAWAASSGCWFNECPKGQTPNVLPPQARSSVTVPPTPSPSPATTPPKRQKKPGEVCSPNGGELYCVSSVLAPQSTAREAIIKYGPENLIDGKYTTAWVADTRKSINGIGETLVIDLSESQSASGVQILNGYRKNFDIYTKNSRVKQMEILLRDGRRQLITLSDTDLNPQAFQFNGGPAQGWIQLKIVSVYPGTKYQDTGITEVRTISATS